MFGYTYGAKLQPYNFEEFMVEEIQNLEKALLSADEKETKALQTVLSKLAPQYTAQKLTSNPIVEMPEIVNFSSCRPGFGG